MSESHTLKGLCLQENYHPSKSRTLVRQVRGPQDASCHGMLMHVHLYVSQKLLAVERLVVVPVATGGCKAVRLRVRVTVPLAAVWQQCAAPLPSGKLCTPSALRDCCWVRPVAEVEAASSMPESSTPVDTAVESSSSSSAASARDGVMLVALDTRILRVEARSSGREIGRQNIMGLQQEKWSAEPLQFPVALAPPPPPLLNSHQSVLSLLTAHR
jgi:hypothetical protein